MSSNEEDVQLVDREKLPNQPMSSQIPMWIPGAENVGLINEMLILKDETLQYIRLHVAPGTAFPSFPVFYHANVYWIYIKTRIQHCQPIYIKCLGEVVKRRINDLFPSSRGNITAPQFIEIVTDYSRFNIDQPNSYTSTFVHRRFEELLGEAFWYLKKHHETYRASPNCPQFLIAFLSVYYMAGYRQFERQSIRNCVMDRLKRNLNQIDDELFIRTQRALDRNFQIIDHMRLQI